eukprot:scaffold2736_cov212-Skeletonema_menzelii.AAC.4
MMVIPKIIDINVRRLATREVAPPRLCTTEVGQGAARLIVLKLNVALFAAIASRERSLFLQFWAAGEYPLQSNGHQCEIVNTSVERWTPEVSRLPTKSSCRGFIGRCGGNNAFLPAPHPPTSHHSSFRFRAIHHNNIM